MRRDPRSEDILDRDDDFSPEERAALAAWTPPAPSEDFAERVLVRAGAEQRRRRVALIAVAASVVIAAGALVLWRAETGRGPASGELTATERTTIQLGDRAVAVVESGATLSWDVEPDVAAAVQQHSGDVFYRVGEGDPFVVRTALGEVTVLGTCFRVEVDPMKNARGALVGGAVGAAVTAVVLVTVYEGRVQATAGGGEAIVEAGGQVELRRGGVAVPQADRPGPTAAPVPGMPRDLVGVGGDRSGREPIPADESPSAAAPDYRVAAERAQQEASALREEVGALRRAVAELKKARNDHRTYDLPQEKLLELASRCELRWDHPAIQTTDPPRLPSDAAETLGLSPEQIEAANEELAAQNARVLGQLRALYTEVTGDDNTASLAPDAMFAEIVDKTDQDEIRRIFQRLSSERAGMLPPPPAGQPAPPTESLYRLLTTAGDDLESALARKIGPKLARSLRDHRDGWGSKSRSSLGCPGE